MNDNISIGIALTILISGALGMYTHFRIAKRDKRVNSTFLEYMLADRPGASGMTVGAFVSAMGVLYSAGTFDHIQFSVFIEALKNGYFYKPFFGCVATSWVTGYVCDSMINKSE